MGKINPYKVTLYPAIRDRGFITTKFTFGETYPTDTFEADSVAVMVQKVTKFATDHGAGCSASVDCLGKRNPPGFAKATDKLYFNLDSIPEPA